MNVIYSRQTGIKNGKSLFLAGPTYRDQKKSQLKSWRNTALQLLNKYEFEGTVYVPQNVGDEFNRITDYNNQVKWETDNLSSATVILFWIPRQLPDLPGFTTNIQAGEWLHSGKILIGAPVGSQKNEYLQKRCELLNIKWYTCLDDMIKQAVEITSAQQPKVWFTSDTHFTQQRTLDLSKRPFKTLEQMDAVLVNNWNKCVSPDDMVFHLGDFGNPEMVQQLNGRIILLSGGYDDRYDNDQFRSLIKQYNPNIALIKQNYELKSGELTFKLIHVPQQGTTSSGDDFFLYGHAHGAKFKRNGLNVGVDCHNYMPIDMATILFYREAILKFYDNNVFMERI